MLFSSASVGRLTLTNRIVLPPMATELATDRGHPTEDLIAHYVRRASVGLVIVEHCWVHQSGKASARQLGVYADECILGLGRLAEAVRSAGAMVALQINHAGAAANRDVTGQAPRGASGVSHPRGTESPMPLDEPELEELAGSFAAAAVRSRQAGFDAVEIHGAHGYLLGQFLSPLTNRRQDRYGGDPHRRGTFPLEVVASVRQAVGPNYPVLYRLGATDFLPGGLSLDEGCAFAGRLARAGVDCIDVSAGLGGFRALSGPGFLRTTARACRQVSGLPVICAGGFDDPVTAEDALVSGDVDLVGVGRAMLADPDWVARARQRLVGD